MSYHVNLCSWDGLDTASNDSENGQLAPYDSDDSAAGHPEAHRSGTVDDRLGSVHAQDEKNSGRRSKLSHPSLPHQSFGQMLTTIGYVQ